MYKFFLTVEITSRESKLLLVGRRTRKGRKTSFPAKGKRKRTCQDILFSLGFLLLYGLYREISRAPAAPAATAAVQHSLCVCVFVIALPSSFPLSCCSNQQTLWELKNSLVFFWSVSNVTYRAICFLVVNWERSAQRSNCPWNTQTSDERKKKRVAMFFFSFVFFFLLLRISRAPLFTTVHACQVLRSGCGLIFKTSLPMCTVSY